MYLKDINLTLLKNMDTITKDKRSWNMSQIRSIDTKPEKQVRTLLHKNGFRYRLYDKRLPGKPDIVLPKYKTVIFVHGCFWHRHKSCKRATSPKTNVSYWNKKFKNNITRDKTHQSLLEDAGWKVIIIWECEVKQLLISPANLFNRIKNLN